MNKIILVVVFLLAFSAAAMANYGPNFPRETDNEAGYVNVAVENTSGLLVGRPLLVYKVSMSANAANTVMEIYDGTSSTSVEATGNSIETADATQYTTVDQVYTTPVNFQYGAYVNVDQGSGK